MSTKPRPHAEIIRAWADGHEVQYRRPGSNEWVDSPDPAFVSDYEYRIKPVRVFPETLLSDGEITRKWKELRNDHMLNYEEERRELINYGIKHAIDNGQVVTREEFDRAIGDRKARDVAIMYEVADVFRRETAVFREDNSYAIRLPTINAEQIIAKVKA